MWQTLRGRSAILAVMAVLATAACGPRPAEDEAAADQVESHSALGDFLAARMAQSAGDTAAAARFYREALAHDPDNVDLMQRAVTLMVAEGQLEDAVPLAERLVELDTESPVPQMVLGVRDTIAGNYAGAEQHFAALPHRGVNSFLGPLLAAWAVAGQGKTDAALASLEPLTANSALKPLHAFHAGLINDLADRAQLAEEQYQVALAAGQLNIRTVEAAGSLFQRTGHPERAKDLYDRYLREHPETLLFDGDHLLQSGAKAPRTVASAREGLAEAMFDMSSLMRQGNATDYAMLFGRLAVALQPDFPLAQMTVADILSAQGRRAEANRLYQSIADRSPVHSFARLRVAINLDEGGDTDGALAELNRIAAADSTAIDALVTKGDLLRHHKHYAEAGEAYGQALARVPGERKQYWALYYSRGICRERAGDWPGAEADLKTALDMQPDQPDVLNYLGYSWIDKGQHLDEARAMIEKAVDLRPTDGAIVDSLGWALYRMGDYQEAVPMLEHAVELKGEDPTINEHLGDAYWRVGRQAEARYQWQRSLDLEPDPEQLEGLKEKVHTGQLPPATPVAR